MNEAVFEFEKAVEAKAPETWYDVGRKEFLIRDSRGDWLPLGENAYKRVLRQHGLSSRVEPGVTVSAIDSAILKMQQDRNIHFSGPLAGYRSGLQSFGSVRVLVTSSPRVIEPVAGEWTTLRALIEGLLGERGGEQLPYLYAWLKIAYEALRAGAIRPGQAVAFCGPHNCGKSLLQNLMTEILGGRAAKPYQAMTGGTGFNADLFGAEHLVVEDESASTDIRARRAFGAQIKNLTVAEGQRLHAKHKDALLVLKPFWRLTISVNDEEENLLVLPPLDESITDKVMLFRARRREMPMPTASIEEREKFWSKMTSELPAFLWYLTRFTIPEELRCQRFGVRHYHHPEIVCILDRMAPEFRLLNLIDGLIFATNGPRFLLNGADHVEMTAEKLESLLLGNGSPCAFEARRLLSWTNACGTYMGRLAKKRPDRLRSARTADERMWMILPPAGWSGGGEAVPSIFLDDLQNAG